MLILMNDARIKAFNANASIPPVLYNKHHHPVRSVPNIISDRQQGINCLLIRQRRIFCDNTSNPHNTYRCIKNCSARETVGRRAESTTTKLKKMAVRQLKIWRLFISLSLLCRSVESFSSTSQSKTGLAAPLKSQYGIEEFDARDLARLSRRTLFRQFGTASAAMLLSSVVVSNPLPARAAETLDEYLVSLCFCAMVFVRQSRRKNHRVRKRCTKQ